MAPFDYDKFERLKGIELGEYCVSKNQEFNLNDKFVEYFAKNSQSLDDQHLEYGIYLLGKIRSKSAYHLIADYLDYPVTFVRFPAIKILTNFEDYDNIPEVILKDSYIIEKARKALEESGGHFVVKELKHLLERSGINSAG